MRGSKGESVSDTEKKVIKKGELKRAERRERYKQKGLEETLWADPSWLALEIRKPLHLIKRAETALAVYLFAGAGIYEFYSVRRDYIPSGPSYAKGILVYPGLTPSDMEDYLTLAMRSKEIEGYVLGLRVAFGYLVLEKDFLRIAQDYIKRMRENGESIRDTRSTRYLIGHKLRLVYVRLLKRVVEAIEPSEGSFVEDAETSDGEDRV